MALFTLDGIDQAIASLNCQQSTLRAKLLSRIRSFYITTEDLDALTTIPAPDLIEELWDVHSPEEIKLKRKNLSGLKSSLNKALKTAIDGGGNPEGIIINKDNVFTVSEEKKNSLIEKLGLLGDQDSIADILNAVQELIKDSVSSKQTSDIESLIQQLDSTKAILTSLGGVGNNGLDKEGGDEGDSEEAEEGDGDEWDNFEGKDEIEEIDAEELVEVEDGAGDDDGGGEESEETEGDNGDEWDNFEGEDEIEEIDAEELVEVEDGAGDDGGGEESEETEGDSGDEWDNFEAEDEIEEIDAEELVEVEDGAGGDGGGEESEKAEGDSGDEWDNFEAEDEIEEIDAEELVEVEEKGNEVAEDGEQKTALSKSLDLSQYIEPKEALDLGEVLQESNEEYIKQILDRFMPKFIKIPPGSYPVGAPKQRNSDRPRTTVDLPAFFIGQHPITNDIFDFFIRETGYITRAEQEGHGLVTSNRIHKATDRESGRTKIVINQGISTTRTAGANWMHPNGPDSSLEGKGNHPVVQVSLTDAMAFAAWAGKRLPTEDEWEVAGRGREGLLYPWGNKPKPLANLANSQIGTTSEVGLYGRLSLSPFGLLDVIGNVAEWTSSFHEKGRHLLITKGGAWANETATCAGRIIETKDIWSNTIGFRCCVNTPSG